MARDLSWNCSSMPVAERAQVWCQRCGSNQCGKVFGLISILGTVCVYAQHPHIGMSRPHGELFFSFLKKEPRVFSEPVRFGHSISAEKVKSCALIGLHMVAKENSWRSDSGSSVSSSSSSGNNVGNDALFVIGLHGSGDTIAIFLQEWEVAKVALSCHIALDMLSQEMHEVERRRGWFGF